MIRNFLLALVGAAATLASAAALGRDDDRTIFYNGKVFTSNERHLWAEGVVVEGRLVIAVGTNQQVLAFRNRNTKLVDLGRRTLVPGFNDAHVHPFDTTSFPRAVQLNRPTDFLPAAGPSLQEILALVQRGAATQAAGTWLMASIGTNVIEDPATTRFAIDQIAPNHPVLLAAWFGHGTFINTKAMQVAGIGEEEPDPFGGSYDRVPGSRVITGALREYAEHRLRRFFAGQMSDAELQVLFEQFAAGAARMGYTSVQEMAVGVPNERHLRLVERANLPIRWRAIGFPLTLDERCDVPSRLSPLRPFAKKTASGCKYIVDGSHIERLALMRRDYADAPGVRGRPNLPASSIETALRRALNGIPAETQPLFHTVGDATTDTILRTMDSVASDKQWRKLRPRIEHGTLVRADRYEKVRSMGAFVIQNPVHFSLVDIANARLHAEQLAELDPMRSLLDRGIEVGIGSDSVGFPGNPYLVLSFAMMQPTNRSEALTMEEAVIAYTRTAAAAEFQEHWKGTLEPGKAADLVVLSRDIFSIAADAIPGTEAELTMVDGRIVHDSGRLTLQ
jgi:predicted amidohydrolase YtcJ